MIMERKGKNISPEKTLSRAAALCSRSEQCEADIRAKLTAWGIADVAAADAIVARLVSESYLSESRYARAFARDRFRFAGWGRLKIAYALRLKRVAEECIADALTEIDEEDYAKALATALQGKLRSVASREPVQQRAALYRFAASRGYESDLAGRAISALLSHNQEDE